MRFGIPVLAVLVAGFVWFMGFQDASAAALSQRLADVVDERPRRSILIVGNSRTFFNDMPSMLREIADSAGSPTKFQIESSAVPAARFEDHWVTVDRSKRLLTAGWDDVILQAASREHFDEEAYKSFLDYGAKLANAAKVKNRRPSLLVNYAYDPAIYENDPDGAGHRDFLQRIRSHHARLASDTGMPRINLAGLWEAARRSGPSIALTVDGNHPSVAGTYLYALAVYAHLSSGPVDAVTYVPDELEPKDAEALRSAVDSFLPSLTI